MARKEPQQQGAHRSRRPGVVQNAKRGGPGRNFWIALGALAIVGIGVLAWQTSQNKPKVTKVNPDISGLKAQGYVMGSPTAPIEIVEFADFECPSCGQFVTLTEPDVRTRLINAGRIRLRYMDFPLEGHNNTWDASLAASCANDQGKFWEMHDQIFANQDKWNSEATKRPKGPLGDLAKGLGLDMTKYNACMDAETHRAQIAANQAEGLRRAVNQTPTFLIGDRLAPGAMSFDQFRTLVDAAIAADSATKAKAGTSTPSTDAAKPVTLKKGT